MVLNQQQTLLINLLVIRNTGWWGHVLETRFLMPPEFTPIPGAQGWQQSNPSIFASAPLQGSLEVFQEAGGIVRLREKSVKLTAYLSSLLQASNHYHPNDGTERVGFTILTPANPDARGCQISVRIFGGMMEKVFEGMKRRGIVGDERRPDVIRLSPTPLYNTYEDCWKAARVLNQAFDEVART
jgi:kynureninase